MTLSAKIEEAYASGGEDLIALVTVETVHAAWSEPIRWVNGIDGSSIDETSLVMLPLVPGGPKVGHRPCAFEVVRPGADKKGPTEGRLRLDGVNRLLAPILREAQGYSEPIRLTFRVYLVSGPDDISNLVGPDEVIEGLELMSVQLSRGVAEGAIRWPDGRSQAVPTGPNAFFDRDNYPALFSA